MVKPELIPYRAFRANLLSPLMLLCNILGDIDKFAKARISTISTA